MTREEKHHILLKLWQSVQPLNEVNTVDARNLYHPETVFINRSQTYVSADTVQQMKVGPGTVIGSGVTFLGCVHIGTDCIIGPHQTLHNVSIGDRVQVGARARLTDTNIGNDCRIGANTEIVRVKMGEKTDAQHFSYIGDAEIGAECNIGAGVVFANYDGHKKDKFLVGKGVFVGSGTVILAPRYIADESIVGAHSLVSKNIARRGSVMVGHNRILDRLSVREKDGWVIIRPTYDR